MANDKPIAGGRLAEKHIVAPRERDGAVRLRLLGRLGAAVQTHATELHAVRALERGPRAWLERRISLEQRRGRPVPCGVLQNVSTARGLGTLRLASLGALPSAG